MHVKLQLVLCSADGREQTVTEIVSWNRDYHMQRIFPRQAMVVSAEAVIQALSRS